MGRQQQTSAAQPSQSLASNLSYTHTPSPPLPSPTPHKIKIKPHYAASRFLFCFFYPLSPFLCAQREPEPHLVRVGGPVLGVDLGREQEGREGGELLVEGHRLFWCLVSCVCVKMGGALDRHKHERTQTINRPPRRHQQHNNERRRTMIQMEGYYAPAARGTKSWR